MNKVLLEEIIKHIFINFGLLKSDFIDLTKTKSLIDKDFLIEEKLTFEDTENNIIKNKVYAISLNVDNSEIKIIVGDCKISNTKEYCLIFQLKNAPAYGLYFIDDKNNTEALMSCSIGEDTWIDCDTYLQAMFLTGSEQLKNYNIFYNKCEEYQEQYKLLISFLKYHEEKFSNE